MVYDYYNPVTIELRAVCRYAPRKNQYQVMGTRPREVLSGWMTKEQAIAYCIKYHLTITKY